MPVCNEYSYVCDNCKKPFIAKRRNDRGELVDLENVYDVFVLPNPPHASPGPHKKVCQICGVLCGGHLGVGAEFDLYATGKPVTVYHVELAQLRALLAHPQPRFNLAPPNQFLDRGRRIGDHVLFVARHGDTDTVQADMFTITGVVKEKVTTTVEIHGHPDYEALMQGCAVSLRHEPDIERDDCGFVTIPPAPGESRPWTPVDYLKKKD